MLDTMDMEVVPFRLPRYAVEMVRRGEAEFCPGGIRNLKTGQTMNLGRPISETVKRSSEAANSVVAGLSKMSAALGWVNVALNLVNIGVSVIGFYMVLSRMTALQGEIHQFISRYKEDRDMDQLEKYNTHIMNIKSHLNFLQNRYDCSEYDKKEFMNREADIEREINETEVFLEKILTSYQKRIISAKLANQIIFTLSPVYAQLVNEYSCQYYIEHGKQNQLFDSWRSILTVINSDSFKTFMQREMTFGIDYVNLSPQRRNDVLTVAFDCIQELIDNLDRCADAVKHASPGILIPVEELLNEMVWNGIRDQIRTEPGETPEEYVTRQIREIELSDTGEEEVIVHLRMA